MNRQNRKMIVYMLLPVLLAGIFGLLMVLAQRRSARSVPDPVVVAIPYSEYVQDPETNYYTRWLEERTGYEISFVYLDEGYERESLNAMLTSENRSVDAVFFPMDQEILSVDEYQSAVKKGLLCAPQEYLPEESNLRRVENTYPEIDFADLTGERGEFFCFPSVHDARTERNLQILWINTDWLRKLKLALPQTAEEFARVLEAFRDLDPNGNGEADELPLVSCEEDISLRSYLYLLNAFSYYDGTCLGEISREGSAPERAFREGVSYCAGLYGQGLLSGACFSYTKKQLMELVNDPADTVGAFASRSIADVIYTNNPDVLAHFVQLAPLSTAFSERGFAVRRDATPSIGGLIPANAAHKEAAARIMDLMLSEEASLIALYGEEGVDWRFSGDGELSSYGARAKVTTIRYLKGEAQNQNYAGAGPLMATADCTDGVTWNGDHSMTEYIDARAVKAYEPYYGAPGAPQDGSGAAQDAPGAAQNGSGAAGSAATREYLRREVLRYITGEREIRNDADWARFLEEYRRLEDGDEG